jgi:serine/threonine protein kinase
MGIVYRALDPAIGRTIAIKSIRLQDLSDAKERERLRERLFREAQSAGILSHPNIVTIYDIAEEDGMAYIFMEFVNGPPLEKMLLQAQSPDGETVLTLLRQTAAALDYAHKKGIIHRDVKPANIMIHEDGTAKVTDFGVAKIMSQQMTMAGTMMGTPSYMSPEQVQGIAVDGRADQFALGVVAYEVLTGEKPFVAEYLPTLLYKIVREDPPPARRLNPTLGAAMEAALNKAISKRPEDRYETCTAFVNALAAACRESDGWVPMPRGASQSVPTAGSQDQLTMSASHLRAPQGRPASAADMETVSDSVLQTGGPEPRIEPPPVANPAAGGMFDPLAREVPPPSHLVRNVALVAAAVVALGVAAMVGLRKPAEETARPASEPPAVSGSGPVSGSAAEAPPPPVEARIPPTLPPQQAAAETEPAPPKPEAQAKQDSVPAPVSTVPQQGAAQSPAAARRFSSGSFQVTTSPAGARVVFDNDPATECVAPCTVTLAAGRHSFVARREGYRDSQRIFEIPKDVGMIVDLIAMTGLLNVNTTPAGLTVWIDGKEQTQKTPLSMSLPVGTHRVQVTRGNDRQQFDVEIRDGGLTSKSIEWAQ